MVCQWSRYFPAGDGGMYAEAWITCDDRHVGGRVLRTDPRIMVTDDTDGISAERGTAR